MNDQWIKMTDRKPTESDYPAWFFAEETIQVHCFRSHGDMKACEPLRDLYTHWMRANQPAPPPKEKTQYDLDRQACLRDSMFPDSGFRDPLNFESGWHAALAWERKEVGALLMTISDMPAAFNYEPHHKAVSALRKRCGL